MKFKERAIGECKRSQELFKIEIILQNPQNREKPTNNILTNWSMSGCGVINNIWHCRP